MEERLEAARLKRSKILDHLLTLEGYWSGPPSSHECSAESGDEQQEAEVLQRRSALKLKGKIAAGGMMMHGRLDFASPPILASPGGQALTPNKIPAMSLGRVGPGAVSPAGAGRAAMHLAPIAAMHRPAPPPQEGPSGGSQQLLSEDAAIIAMLSKATHPQN
ncbi:hypothetical protein GUITHDRAFT_150156 [Guillardia theta CCMP2712]|uniref:Uncharacterized protein n=2 Tax=Guillardia theta TaxID=55529 RepID=L1JZT0_GUITC|nr:hypothetical protein GUITHDRAFT_150156 [Guillardia theta CCMP2712]EKX54116.1 hypothetical protein GUITHDRAFT_150156 [Guillardia theta CCMP2712]|eukprot:XP_005841096.1 hypothetical protein GUITHDRAFT_150156 [Guillardia theta CCMP2712]